MTPTKAVDNGHCPQLDFRARGAFDDPVADDRLEDLAALVGFTIDRLGHQLDEALHPAGVARVDDPVSDTVAPVLTMLDAAVSVYARLMPLVHRRRAAVEAGGFAWLRHLEEIDAWRERSAA